MRPLNYHTWCIEVAGFGPDESIVLAIGQDNTVVVRRLGVDYPIPEGLYPEFVRSFFPDGVAELHCDTYCRTVAHCAYINGWHDCSQNNPYNPPKEY